jgi:uncharacterized protein (DUF4415 family)
MNGKSQNSAPAWVDPDDAPELTEEDLQRGSWKIGAQVVTRREAQATIARQRGRPPGTTKASPKVSTTIRLSSEVVEAFKAGGDGWQTRIDAALKDWLRSRAQP